MTKLIAERFPKAQVVRVLTGAAVDDLLVHPHAVAVGGSPLGRIQGVVALVAVEPVLPAASVAPGYRRVVAPSADDVVAVICALEICFAGTRRHQT